MVTAGSPDTQVGIVGAGFMGAGIARSFADLGVKTIIVAPRPGGVERATAIVQQSYAGDIQRNRISETEAKAGLAKIHITSDYAEMAEAEFVIESVPEHLETKHEVLAKTEYFTGDKCIFGTNTSSIPIPKIAAGAQRPGNVIGMHYFWPAHRYKLVEVSYAQTTPRSTIDRTMEMVSWLGKTALLVRGDLPGFFTTRVLVTYLNEAIALVVEGASVDVVDKAMTDFGWPMGPFQLLDAAGMDIAADVYEWIKPHLGERVAQIERLFPVAQAGHVGYKRSSRKQAKGFYIYPEGREVDPRIYPLMGQQSHNLPEIQEIIHRPIWQMINEVAYCIEEKVIASAEDADLGAVLALGWPRTLGGPIAYARQIGPEVIVRQLEMWAEKHGPRFKPSRILSELNRETLWS